MVPCNRNTTKDKKETAGCWQQIKFQVSKQKSCIALLTR